MTMQAAATINRHMLTVDQPDHTRLRNLVVHRAFTPRMMRELGGRIQEIADDLIDNMQANRKSILMENFTIPLPITVIAELLGIPVSDQAKFREWTQIIVVEGSRVQPVIVPVQPPSNSSCISTNYLTNAVLPPVKI